MRAVRKHMKGEYLRHYAIPKVNDDPPKNARFPNPKIMHEVFMLNALK
jgi:hypothetical protein